MRILIAGGTGFLGSYLTEALLRKGHEVVVLTRQSPSQFGPTPYRLLTWPLHSQSDVEIAQSCDVAINLAGEPINKKRWTAEQKILIKNSRIEFTKQLTDVLRGSTKLKVFLSSSGIGFYGHRKTEVLNEDSPRGEGFLADICNEWEATALDLKTSGLRTVLLRTSVVLARGFGFIQELEPLFRNWIGGRIGSGDQMISWIHIEDWVRAVLFCLENESIKGPVNLCSPEPVSNGSFSALFGELFQQPVQIPAPSMALKVVLGEMSSLALESQNARPEKLLNAGFKFSYPHLKDALWAIYDFEKNNKTVYQYFAATTWIPSPIEKVFEFFASEKNLETMTPSELNFHVLNKSTAQIMKGTLIDYKLKIHGLPVKWQTLITDWTPPHRFADQQLKGPYSYWHHVHTFEKLAGGTLMKDVVEYSLPLGGLGRLAGGCFVRRDIENIFSFRKKTMLNMNFSQ